MAFRVNNKFFLLVVIFFLLILTSCSQYGRSPRNSNSKNPYLEVPSTDTPVQIQKK